MATKRSEGFIFAVMCLIAGMILLLVLALTPKGEECGDAKKEYPPYEIVPGHHFVKK